MPKKFTQSCWKIGNKSLCKANPNCSKFDKQAKILGMRPCESKKHGRYRLGPRGGVFI